MVGFSNELGNGSTKLAIDVKKREGNIFLEITNRGRSFSLEDFFFFDRGRFVRDENSIRANR